MEPKLLDLVSNIEIPIEKLDLIEYLYTFNYWIWRFYYL